MGPPLLTEPLMRWVEGCFPAAATSVSVSQLRSERPPWLVEVDVRGERVRAVLKAGADVQPDLLTEVAALAAAASAQLATPRLIAADLSGADAGVPAMLLTYVEGETLVPLVMQPARLHAAGVAASTIHRVSLAASAELPVRHRHMPWIDFAAERRSGRYPTTPLLDLGDRVLRDAGFPCLGDAPVLVHGDLWLGNLVWRGDDVVATIDWEAAGSGDPGVDVGSLRLDAALMYGAAAADAVAAGWIEGSGRTLDNLPAWDVVAALNTPADMADVVPSLAEAGRSDLDGSTLDARRDEFLRAALDALGAVS